MTSNIRSIQVRDEGDPLPPPPARIEGLWEQLACLEHWASFAQTDGFIHFHHVDSGALDLACGADVSVPWVCYTPEEQAQVEADDGVHGDGLPDAGWVAEFTAGMLGGDCELPLKGGDHCVGYGLTLTQAVDRCYEAVRTGVTHDCRRAERREATKVAMRLAKTLFDDGRLDEHEFPEVEDAVIQAVQGHWRFYPRPRDLPTPDQIAAILLAEHPDVRKIVDLRPEDQR